MKSFIALTLAALLCATTARAATLGPDVAGLQINDSICLRLIAGIQIRGSVQILFDVYILVYIMNSFCLIVKYYFMLQAFFFPRMSHNPLYKGRKS
jgi:hypothetical protein